MKTKIIPILCCLSACMLAGAREKSPRRLGGSELQVKGNHIAANRKTGELVATGGVSAVSGVYRFNSESVTRSAKGVYDFGHPANMTTCTNAIHKLHWQLRGEFEYIDGSSPEDPQHKAVIVRNAWLYWMDLPVLWVPFWYYPIDTNYGWRFMPGYTSKWGGFIKSGYVYNIVNEGKEDANSLGGSTYFDYRTEKGAAVGQTIRWNLGNFGKGKIKGYYAWDTDYDRYDKHWTDHRHHYQNWGSEVDRDRYRVVLEHKADFTERDSLRVHANLLSDSHFLYDFFDRDERGESIPVNEAAYEHHENDWALGGSVSGPLNDFYGGTARLPEGWFSIQPQPIWELPVNYESQTRAGFMNRDYARYAADDAMFRYHPYIGENGRGADYQAARADINQRITLPMKFGDVLSLVPRAGYRATAWSDSGSATANHLKASGNSLYRGIAQAGVTASARASGWITENWKHTFEPYIDYEWQRSELSAGGKNGSPYIFDAVDGSVDWLDQFGFEGRGLPYSWHGVRPGIRNLFQRKDAAGNMRNMFDTDAYAAIPFTDEDYFANGLPEKDETGHYSRRENVVPGIRARLFPTDGTSLSARTEYECDEEKLSYADLIFRHRVTKSFDYHVSYIGRDHRIWDYLPSEYERWNYELSNIAEVGFTHSLCDWMAYSPFVRYDARCNELEEYGAWLDILTDCLGYRFLVEHESSYRRIDDSKRDADTRFCFFIYLRALGPGSMLDLMKF